MNNIIVENKKLIGKIKPMHGVGQPPLINTIDCSMFDYLAKADVPFSRLHDVGGPYGGNRFVDIPNLFRNFDADPQNPAAYDFAFTDIIITELMKRGIQPFFRLGVTIETKAYIKAYRIYPPEDNLKWAKICEGIIRHYTQGWADGFYYDIKYWEIWNEPDNFEDPMENQCWRGNKEQYYELYGTASRYLKEKFPHLKIGGYGSCGFYAVVKEAEASFANCAPRYDYFIEFFDGFLAYVKANNCPFDFFSWHSYCSIENNLEFAAYARKRLDEEGFTNTEHTLNEWNYKPDDRGSLEHASITTAMLLALQNTSLDSAMFYDAKCGLGVYSGLFDPIQKAPRPAYYGFVAFAELFRRKNQVEVTVTEDGVYAVAAKDEDGCLIIANTNEHAIDLQISISELKRIEQCKIICEDNIWCECDYPDTLPGYSVLCVYYKLERAI